ncbi:MAG: ATP-binding protein [Armatimonadota bacterium]|nr:ATP-binding protein [bacterium]
MRELSMHILDLAQNSIAAGATELVIEVSADTQADRLMISLQDNGRGMDSDFLARVRDPFTTTRTTRRVGLGIPMFEAAAKACGGCIALQSAPGKGTYLAATFRLSHIDRAPLGDIASTLMSIVAANPDLRLRYTQRLDDKLFVLDTNDVKAQLDGVPINEGAVLKWLGEYVNEGTDALKYEF